MDPDHLRDLFSEFGRIEIRRMFSGAGIFRDGVMFALVSGGEIYLKTDKITATAFENAGSKPFSYKRKGGKQAVMSYWRLPEALYDDPRELADWARDALTVARKAARKNS